MAKDRIINSNHMRSNGGTKMAVISRVDRSLQDAVKAQGRNLREEAKASMQETLGNFPAFRLRLLCLMDFHRGRLCLRLLDHLRPGCKRPLLAMLFRCLS